MSLSRWDRFVWPKWLPETARMPLVAQVTGAVALTALIMGPWWSRVPTEPPVAATLPASTPPAEIAAVPLKPAVTPAAPAVPAPSRPAHLNLDVRHSFASVDLSVTIDGQRVLDSKLEGSGKKFKMFGKRDVRSFTRSLDLAPGVRVVNVRLKSAEDRFDQTRTERFELGSASVASMRITAAKDGLDVIAQHPAPQPSQPAAAPEPVASPTPVTAATTVPVPAALPSASAQRADAIAELLNSLRSMLIAIAGFVASAATGFVVQEYMRSRKEVIFTPGRRRRRTPEEPADAIEAE
jgi:hypothetical protein